MPALDLRHVDEAVSVMAVRVSPKRHRRSGAPEGTYGSGSLAIVKRIHQIHGLSGSNLNCDYPKML